MNLIHYLSLLLAVAPLAAGSQPTFTQGELNFEVTGVGECSVIASPGVKGALVIPETVVEENVEYRVTTIAPSAFSGCGELTELLLPSSVTHIGDEAFRSCTGLNLVELGSGVAAIGDMAFRGCSSLALLVLPPSTPQCGKYIFMGCSALKAVDIPEGWSSVPSGLFARCAGLTSVTMPSTITSIGDEAFSDCTAIARISIPDGVSTIGRKSFYDCTSLTDVTLGSGMTSIGMQAFGGCSKITAVRCMAQTPPATGLYVFDTQVYTHATLNVPTGSLIPYSIEPIWKEFADMKESDFLGNDPTLTLKFPDGSIVTTERAGRPVSLKINIPDGWKLVTALFNDTEVTDEISEQGYYTTPPLLEASVLSIVVGENSGILTSDTDTPKLRAFNGTLYVGNLPEDAVVEICDVAGHLIFRGHASTIPVPVRGTVIVRISDRTYKLNI